MPAPSTLRRTPLHPLHLQHGARIVPFAGYEMPLNYPDGILAEHRHTRRFAGLFDVSHLGRIIVFNDNGRDRHDHSAAASLESLIPSDILSLPVGRQKYGLLTTPEGGILDDLMIQNLGDRFELVVNAACKRGDFEHLQRHIGDAHRLEFCENTATLALQGPASAAVMAAIGEDLGDMAFMDVRELSIDGVACVISRSGYTGEDGFELSLPADAAEGLARRLLAHPAVQLVGLGARDSLRLEAGLCLYGQDITTATTPSEAGLHWAISPARRLAGERPGGFPGAHIILPQLSGMPENVSRLRVGLLPQGGVPIRRGAPLLDGGGEAVGEVTSGGFGPSLGRPLALGYVKREHAAVGSDLQALVRRKLLPVSVAGLPFVAANFYRRLRVGVAGAVTNSTTVPRGGT